MRLVIEAEDFKTLSDDTQQELLRRFAGDTWVEKYKASNEANATTVGLAELSPKLAASLVDGVSDADRRRLQMFAERGGRVESGELLSAGGEHAMEKFEERMTGKLRELGDRKVSYAPLFAVEDVAGEHVYRTSEVTARSLRCCFPLL